MKKLLMILPLSLARAAKAVAAAASARSRWRAGVLVTGGTLVLSSSFALSAQAFGA